MLSGFAAVGPTNPIRSLSLWNEILQKMSLVGTVRLLCRAVDRSVMRKHGRECRVARRLHCTDFVPSRIASAHIDRATRAYAERVRRFCRRIVVASLEPWSIGRGHDLHRAPGPPQRSKSKWSTHCF